MQDEGGRGGGAARNWLEDGELQEAGAGGLVPVEDGVPAAQPEALIYLQVAPSSQAQHATVTDRTQGIRDDG